MYDIENFGYFFHPSVNKQIMAIFVLRYFAFIYGIEKRKPHPQLFPATESAVLQELPAFYSRANVIFNRYLDSTDGNDVAGL